MKRMILLIIGSCIVVVPVAGQTGDAATEPGKAKADSGEAREILKKADDALKKVKSVRYKAQYQGTGWVTAHVASVEGSVMLGEPSEHDVTRFRCEVKLTPPKSEETIELTAGSDGDLFYLIDPKTKTVYADIDDAVLGKHQRNARRVLMREFMAKEPLADDLKAEQSEVEGTADVGGEACHQVHVTRSETQEVIWFISKKDWLPRRVDRVYKNPEGETGSTQLVLTDLAAATTFSVEPFKLAVPEGFTKTDEFAP